MAALAFPCTPTRHCILDPQSCKQPEADVLPDRHPLPRHNSRNKNDPWLEGGEGVHGGVYLWQDREACESFLAGELWAEAENDDSVLDLKSQDFAVMEELTRTTQPGMQLLP